MDKHLEKIDAKIEKYHLSILIVANLVMVVLVGYTVSSWHSLYVAYKDMPVSQTTNEEQPTTNEVSVETEPKLLTEEDHDNNHARLAELQSQANAAIDESRLDTDITTVPLSEAEHRNAILRLETLTAYSETVGIVEE